VNAHLRCIWGEVQFETEMTMLILISVFESPAQLAVMIGDNPYEVEPAKGRFSKWADPSDESYSRETAAEDRRAAILEAWYGNRN